MVWDTTSLDTFAPSYLQSATSAAGAVAALVENRKKGKYGCLDSTYTFIPIAIESSGACGPDNGVSKGPRQPPEADHRGELIQVPPP